MKECRSTSYDALNAHTAIVFTRYMLLSVAKRKDEDERTFGEMFHITESQLEELSANFIGRLPEYMQKALNEAQLVA